MQTLIQSKSNPIPGLTGFKFDFASAADRLKEVVIRTPLTLHAGLSGKYQANIYLKREDLQVVRSYKIRGAYNMMSQLPWEQLRNGVVCASAGNHAQGFAYSCKKLGVPGVVFMPVTTPNQKINQTKKFGDQYVEIKLDGDTYDECAVIAQKYCQANKLTYVHPFDHYKIIEGQGTIGIEILEDQPDVDYLFVPVGGGGLCAGVGTYFKTYSPRTKIIGAEPEGAPSMKAALEAGEPVTLTAIERFVDGAAVQRVGNITFSLCREALTEIHLVQEGKICSSILSMYNDDAMVVEPAGVLSVAALDDYAEKIKGKNVVCIISGSNNDISRMQEIRERSMQYEGLKHYFLIRFAQRPGSLKDFVNEILGPGDDITRFEYFKKHNKESGPALVGIEVRSKNDYLRLLANLDKHQVNYSELKENDNAFGFLV
ncbi:MAG TPA: threonine ammonia-lyase [Saprospiraceae bacterium]|nr:threonine ammonia-lyase [Saprospiraceae bacterium]